MVKKSERYADHKVFGSDPLRDAYAKTNKALVDIGNDMGSHVHDGEDAERISHVDLLDKGSYTHEDIDSHMNPNDQDGAEHPTATQSQHGFLHRRDKMKLDSMSTYASNPDAFGTYTTITYKRPDGTVYAVAKATDADESGNYGTITTTYYDENGSTKLVGETETYTMTYDQHGNIVTKVVELS